MVSPNRKTRPSPASIMSSPRIQHQDEIKRQLMMLTSCALFLFVMGTLILMTKMPDPSTLHSVDTVVKSSSGHLKDERARRAAAIELERIRSRAKELNHIAADKYHLKDGDKPSANEEGEHSSNEKHEKKRDPAVFQPKLRENVSQSKHKLRMANSDSASPPRLIHILETRFMQNQPNLVELAKARLHLFATICLPTVIKQSSWGEFAWVIRTDPNLDEQIKKDLISLLKRSGALKEVAVDKDGNDKRSLTYVVGSNDNYILANSTNYKTHVKPFDIRDMLSSMVSNPDSLFAGKFESAQSLLNEINSKQSNVDNDNDDVILWTRLDADDGLNLGYMEYVQSQAVRFFLPEYYGKDMLKEITVDEQGHIALPDVIRQNPNLPKRRNKYTPPKWTYWCAGRNIDWFITDLIHDPAHKNGTVYPVQHVNVCVTPGVTVALRGSFDPLKVPRLDHDKIISYLRPKGPKLCHRSGISIFDESDEAEKDDKEEPDDGSCFHMVNAYYFAALRSRTPTSAGMMGVSPDDMQLMLVKKQPILTYAMWVLMVREFGVSNKTLIGTNEYFAKHVYDIAEENARGQCTRGHSCKTSSKDLLQQYADLKREMQNGFDVVDGFAMSAQHISGV
ncbi:hypothetical protein ACHAXN_009762 [Cyclotella atomus]